MPYDIGLESLPEMVDAGGFQAPKAPEQIADTGVDEDVLRDLALKLAYTTPQFTTDWAVEQLCLPHQLTEEIYWSLKQDKLVEILGQVSTFSYKYAATERGRQHAERLMEICGYVGPAPVSLDAYAALLEYQSAGRDDIQFEDVTDALGKLVLPGDAVNVAALAAASGRSLFLFGPPGNGKTSVGLMLHDVMKGDMWIPYCLATTGGAIINMYDRQCHVPYDPDTEPTVRVDKRWLRIKRPLLVAGGEMTIAELDLAYSPSLRFYESPPHMKANGGTFLIDDFGRQRIEPFELLNRWIIPLEHRVDHFTLITGQKLQLPFRTFLIVATNLSVDDVADPAFLRRMGYRLFIDRPSQEDYREIFRRYAKMKELESPPELIDWLLERYAADDRKLQASEPRDLIERSLDICKLHHKPRGLNKDVLDVAWRGYFGGVAKDTLETDR